MSNDEPRLTKQKELSVWPLLHFSTNLPAIEAALKEAGNRDYRIVEMPGLNHLFQTAGTGAPTEYSTISETFSPAALDLIATWINAYAARSR